MITCDEKCICDDIASTDIITRGGYMGFSADTSLKKLLDDSAARAVLVKHLGERTNDPRVNQVLYESLRSISYYPEAGISKETLEKIDTELKAL